ncbi:hypothetical protein E2C01_042636 [Portunus trituberculatus]|uniref:Uncharacterized protein n=1 Tax=Portunus trituberculatus TaxID=210409 RepID=A0A5B7FMX0_PORTR|nr:hypothetical protein [Portunus trituberculatus]
MPSASCCSTLDTPQAMICSTRVERGTRPVLLCMTHMLDHLSGPSMVLMAAFYITSSCSC